MSPRNCNASLVMAMVILLCFMLQEGALPAQSSPKLEKGKELCQQYCASCHGLDGKGNGPVAVALNTPPSDLTTIQKKGEKFPAARVTGVIDGSKLVSAHGTRDMPIWGTVFASKGQGQKQANIEALVRYLESIQAAK